MSRISDEVLSHLDEVLGDASDEETFDLAATETFAHGGPLVRVGDRFEITATIGVGGMAQVYRATDATSGREVALKVQHAGEPWLDRRFEREAQVLASLDHPRIVRYVAHGKSLEGVLWLATELLVGETLAECVSRGALKSARALAVAEDVGSALAVIHARGFVHRDVKPANIFIGHDGRATLLDLGLLSAGDEGAGEVALTHPRSLLGTIGYLSPEQASGQAALGPATDYFALGCVLFECLAGQPPFGRTLEETAGAFAMGAEPPLGRLPAALGAEARALVGDLLQRDPTRRPGQPELALRLAAVRGAQGAGTTQRLPAVSSRLDGSAARVDLVWWDASPISHLLALAPNVSCGGGDRERVEAILARARMRSVDDIPQLVANGLTLVTGRLVLDFDARERSLAELAARRSVAGPDSELRELPASVRARIARLADTALYESRSFVRTRVFGGTVRARLHGFDGHGAVPLYLREEAVSQLPLTRTLPIRAAVAVHPSQDPSEASAVALSVVALARVVELPYAERRGLP